VVLQDNPIAKAIHSGPPSRVPVRAAIAVRTHILRVAAACRSEETRIGRKSSALRRYAIIAGICAGDLPTKTASELGLSLRQYYRDRKSICTRVARRLLENPRSSLRDVELHEPLQLALRRAVSLVEQGFALRAAAFMKEVSASLESPSEKLAATLSRSVALVNCGSIVLATEAFEEARGCLGQSPFISSALRAQFALSAVELAIESGQDKEAASLLEDLLQELRNDEASKELEVDAFLESCFPCPQWTLPAIEGRAL
jgi:hypothetical protein